MNVLSLLFHLRIGDLPSRPGSKPSHRWLPDLGPPSAMCWYNPVRVRVYASSWASGGVNKCYHSPTQPTHSLVSIMLAHAEFCTSAVSLNLLRMVRRQFGPYQQHLIAQKLHGAIHSLHSLQGSIRWLIVQVLLQICTVIPR